jgi:hypothetical protein
MGTTTNSSFDISELDLFLHKNLSSSISTLVDLQLLNNFSTSNDWGDFNLDEAWVKFDLSRYCIIKTGYIVPTFNSFNEIKTKFPLFPYVLRPIIYESSMNNMINPEPYLPSHVMVQVNGTAPIDAAKLDYAIFAGNSDFTQSVSATDSTNYKLVGGRIGVRDAGVKAGVSGTYDYTRNDDINSTIATINTMTKGSLSTIGSIPRARFGADLSFSHFGFSFESEYIHVWEFPDSAAKGELSAAATASATLPNSMLMIHDGLAKNFAYASLTYTFFEKLDVTALITYLQNQTAGLLSEGVKELHGCVGYHISDDVTLKFEYRKIYLGSTTSAGGGNDLLGTAVSVAF